MQQRLLGSLLTFLLILLLAACGASSSTEDGDSTPADGDSDNSDTTPDDVFSSRSATLDATGGSLSVNGPHGEMIQLSIPANALSVATDITVYVLNHAPVNTLENAPTLALRLEPDGLQLDAAATLSVNLSSASSQWFYLKGAAIALPLAQEEKDGSLVASLSHFSDYVLGEVTDVGMKALCDNIVSTVQPQASCKKSRDGLDALLRCSAYFLKRSAADGDANDLQGNTYHEAAQTYSTEVFTLFAEAEIPKGDYCREDSASASTQHFKDLYSCVASESWEPSAEAYGAIHDLATEGFMEAKAREFLADTSIPAGDPCIEGAVNDYVKMITCLRNNEALVGVEHAEVVHELEIRYVQTYDRKGAELAAYSPKEGECEWYYACLEKLIQVAEVIGFDEAEVSDATLEAMKNRKQQMEEHPDQFNCDEKAALYTLTVIVHHTYEQPSVGEDCGVSQLHQEATLRFDMGKREFLPEGCGTTNGGLQLLCGVDNMEQSMTVVLSDPPADWSEGPVMSSSAYVTLYEQGGQTYLDFNFEASSSEYLDPSCSGEMIQTHVWANSQHLCGDEGGLVIPFDDSTLRRGLAYTYTKSYRSEDQCDVGCYTSFEIDMIFEPIE